MHHTTLQHNQMFYFYYPLLSSCCVSAVCLSLAPQFVCVPRPVCSLSKIRKVTHIDNSKIPTTLIPALFTATAILLLK
ncbi:hypothetical protein BKA61DRAFT_134363 [Leptodontidium sp. MPI-SDFR-AT-0119]|nr:hypothetical protein BKA61DRAFT_134363 [Leptodontidium sp. MPI-SDFR-AT-0119]